jgi:hypothetical protein
MTTWLDDQNIISGKKYQIAIWHLDHIIEMQISHKILPIIWPSCCWSDGWKILKVAKSNLKKTKLLLLHHIMLADNWLLDQKASRTQSYKISFGVITPFLGVNYATFLRTNLSIEINAKINAKNIFCRNSDSKKPIYRIKKSFILIN